MKSSRLLSLLLLLQTHERMTTAELADRLEVSRRTVLRDVEALGEAGVPVYAERGRHGGIVLLTGTRLNAAHLDPGELDVLMLTGLDHHGLRLLGLHATVEQAGRKLAARRARSLTPGQRRLTDLIVIDNSGWASNEHGADVAGLAEALLQGQRLRIDYRRSGATGPITEVVDPYGLALKAGRWYLVADVAGHPRLFALTRLSAFEVVPEPCRPRRGQTLASVWNKLRARAEPQGTVRVRAWLRFNRLDLAQRILGSRLLHSGAQDGEWTLITVQYDEIESVRQVLQFGDHIRVVEPPEARHRVQELAQTLAANHAATAASIDVPDQCI